MTNRIYLPLELADGKPVVRVGGKCFKRVRPVHIPPDTFVVEDYFASCDSCEAGSESASSSSSSVCIPDPPGCLCCLQFIEDQIPANEKLQCTNIIFSLDYTIRDCVTEGNSARVDFVLTITNNQVSFFGGDDATIMITADNGSVQGEQSSCGDGVDSIPGGVAWALGIPSNTTCTYHAWFDRSNCVSTTDTLISVQIDRDNSGNCTGISSVYAELLYRLELCRTCD